MAQKFDIGSGNVASAPVFSGTDITLQFSMTPVTNVTGWTVLLSFKKNVSDNTFIKQYATGSGVTVTDVGNGVWSVNISRADTLLFTVVPGTYCYSFERTDSGFATVLVYGAFQVDRKVNS